jgi:hypothetical protein
MSTLCSKDKDNLRINMVLEIPSDYVPFSEIIKNKPLFVKAITNLDAALSELKSHYNFKHNNLNTSNVYVNGDGEILIGGLSNASTGDLPLPYFVTESKITGLAAFINSLTHDYYHCKLILQYRNNKARSVVNDLNNPNGLYEDLQKDAKSLEQKLNDIKAREKAISKNDEEIELSNKKLHPGLLKRAAQAMGASKSKEKIVTEILTKLNENKNWSIEIDSLLTHAREEYNLINQFKDLYTMMGIHIPEMYEPNNNTDDIKAQILIFKATS